MSYLLLIFRSIRVLLAGLYAFALFLFLWITALLFGRVHGFKRWYWRFMAGAFRVGLRIMGIKVVTDESSLRRLGTLSSSVIASNHRSHLDVLVLMSIAPRAERLTFCPKIELCRLPMFVTGFKAAEVIPIDRTDGRSAMRGLVNAVGRLPDEVSPVLFPEGTRHRGTGIGPLKPGVIIAARNSGRTICPVIIDGTDALFPPGAYLPKAGTVKVSVLPGMKPLEKGNVNDDIARLHAMMIDGLEDSGSASRIGQP